MQEIGTPDGQFRGGDPFNNVRGTPVTPEWLNALQGEVVSVIQAAGIALNPAKVDQLYAALQSLFAPAANITQPIGDRSTKTATDRFVADALGAWAIIDCSGNQDINLSQAQWGAAILVLTGVPTANITLILPAQGDQHKVLNKCALPVSLRAAAGGGVTVPPGAAYAIFYDGADLRTVEAPDASAPGVLYCLAG